MSRMFFTYVTNNTQAHTLRSLYMLFEVESRSARDKTAFTEAVESEKATMPDKGFRGGGDYDW